jgi:hypothetical protein
MYRLREEAEDGGVCRRPGVLVARSSRRAVHDARVTHAQVVRAKERLDRLDLYPRPVRVGHVRLCCAPWFFRLPWLRRFDGFALHWTILVRAPDPPDDLVVHELCHVWQMQHRPIAMPLSYLRSGYTNNAYEREARAADELTR